MELLINDSKNQRLFNAGRRVGAVAGSYSVARIKRLGTFTAASRTGAMIHVDAILERGHFASLSNIASDFVVTESVLV